VNANARRDVVRKIKVLGAGCQKCNKLADLALEAAKSTGVEFEIEKVTDINEIVAFGVMVTPALVVDGEVKVTGRVPTVQEIKAMLS
jgi:small redox-active disulfide protein 2